MKLDANKYYGTWSGQHIGTFLEASRIPLRVSLMTKNGLLIVPIWFEYRDNCFFSCSPNSSLLVDSLRENPEIAFDLSTNDIPYQGVRGRGLARCSIASNQNMLNKLLLRYVNDTDSSFSQWLLGRKAEEAIIEIEITWLTSWDFSNRMPGKELKR